jgi:hypothetical protein
MKSRRALSIVRPSLALVSASVVIEVHARSIFLMSRQHRRSSDLATPESEWQTSGAGCGPSRASEHVGFARWYYDGDDFPVQQVVWPSKTGLFPWHPEASIEFRAKQPVLGQHEIGA